MSASQSDEPDRTGRTTKRRILTCAAAAAAFLLVGSAAWACIPWAGEVILTNNPNHDTSGERATSVFGADHTDIELDGSTGDRGNGQGMVWCDVDDADAGQQYNWAEVRMDGTSDWDVELTVRKADDGEGDDCASDVNLPEDDYSITFQEDSFDNHDDSQNGNNEETFADDRSSSDNGGSDEVADGHCMDLDDDETDGTNDDQVNWNLVEDDTPTTPNDQDDSESLERFPQDGNNDIVNGPESIRLDLDNDFATAPNASDSGDDSDGDGHVDALGLCITSFDEYHHDNNGSDNEDDSEVVGGEKDDIMIEYGNAIPVNILPSS